MIVKIITEGNLGKYFLQIIKKEIQNRKVANAPKFTLIILLKTSYKFIKISLCCSIFKSGLFNHNAQVTCHNAIVIQTDIKNQCKAVDGINVIYFVALNI